MCFLLVSVSSVLYQPLIDRKCLQPENVYFRRCAIALLQPHASAASSCNFNWNWDPAVTNWLDMYFWNYLNHFLGICRLINYIFRLIHGITSMRVNSLKPLRLPCKWNEQIAAVVFFQWHMSTHCPQCMTERMNANGITWLLNGVFRCNGILRWTSFANKWRFAINNETDNVSETHRSSRCGSVRVRRRSWASPKLCNSAIYMRVACDHAVKSWVAE